VAYDLKFIEESEALLKGHQSHTVQKW